MQRIADCVGWRLALALLVTVAGTVALPAAPAAPEAAEAEGKVLADDWYAVYLAGSKIGHQHSWTVELKDGDAVLYRTRTREASTIIRGTVTIDSSGYSDVVEDAQGRLVRFSTQSVQGTLPRVISGEVKGEKLTMEVTTSRSKTQLGVPVPKGLCDWAALEKVKAVGLKPGAELTVPVFSADNPAENLEITFKIGPVEEAKLGDETKRLHRIDTELKGVEGTKMRLWVDDEYVVWLIRNVEGLLTTEIRKVTKEAALAENEEVDINAVALVKVDKPIRRARRLEQLKMALEPIQPGIKLPNLLSDDFQKVVRDGATLKLSILRAHPDPEKSYPRPCKDKKLAALMKPTVWLETEDAKIVELTEAALFAEKDALKAARNLERFVRDYITNKNMASTMATAAEVAETKSGDCSEHAMLLAALARAAGLPSRAAAGLVYTAPGEQSGFQFHMWTEIYVGEWMPFDAALFGHDATHITIVRSNLDKPGLLGLNTGVGRFLGKVKAKIELASPRRPRPVEERDDD
jgi:Transglutaminase-like superfamily